MSELIQSISDNDFEDVVMKSTMPVLVDFWAPWCGPCKRIGPVLEALAPEYKNSLKIVKVNVDECEDTPAKFGVRGIPTLLIFKDGSVVDTNVGALNETEMKTFINKNIETN